jgi:phospholipase C
MSLEKDPPANNPATPTGSDRPAASVDRRQFVIAAAASSLALAGCSDAAERLVAPSVATLGQATGGLSSVQHVIVVMMENRSFDHFLGWLPGADGKQAGLTYPAPGGGPPQATYPLAPDFQGCGFTDPDHTFAGGRIQYDGGKCDGWLLADSDRFAIGYYRAQDLKFFNQAAPGWTTCDRFFCSILGPTFPNRIYQNAAQTDRLDNSLGQSSLTTIWDRLFQAGLGGKYYSSDAPFLALWGSKYLIGPQAINHPIADFYSDCAAGTLPEVAFVDPPFVGAELGLSADDHPFADIRVGQSFLNDIYTAVTRSPAWPGIVLVLSYDEWGGFFDHVPPPTGSVTLAEQALGYTDGRLGFRVPAVVVSPFARRQFVSHEVIEHTSILKLIEDRWNLAPLTDRDAAANSLANVLDFASRNNRRPPKYSVPKVTPSACPTPVPVASAVPASPRSHWAALLSTARANGWRG